MAFELFDAEVALPTKVDPAPKVVIGNERRFLVNRAGKRAFEQVRPGATAAELWYDRDTRRVGIHLLNSSSAEAPDRVVVSQSRSKEWPVLIEARAFVEHWKLGSFRGPAFTLDRVKDGPRDLIVFDLREHNVPAGR